MEHFLNLLWLVKVFGQAFLKTLISSNMLKKQKLWTRKISTFLDILDRTLDFFLIQTFAKTYAKFHHVPPNVMVIYFIITYG